MADPTIWPGLVVDVCAGEDDAEVLMEMAAIAAAVDDFDTFAKIYVLLRERFGDRDPETTHAG